MEFVLMNVEDLGGLGQRSFDDARSDRHGYGALRRIMLAAVVSAPDRASPRERS